ncbi:hypothetical protein FRUB_05037 [Fimbriiglobus ruber]|uniref:Uncharacterized protein n=1 Tax=Fimbriiglobus ruber TaxID=1908690 RepID=A0A225DXR8_9BACT|nr:hypothetical protein FRUB_05037 [Fimbriiglobus ruber]
MKSFVHSVVVDSATLQTPENTGDFKLFRFSPTSICQWRRLVKA